MSLLTNISKNLIEQLHDNGVMEYKAISWDNHRSGDNFRDLTINLAVWFLCILAGNDHRPQWEYGPLAEESLASKTNGNTQSLTQVNTLLCNNSHCQVLSSLNI